MSKKVEIYSTPTCHFCHMAKDYFKEHDIEFTDYNVGTDVEKRREMLEKSGQMGVPVIVVDGKDLIVGFNKPVLSKLLRIPG
ncbi:MAG: Glutaredoxin-like protein, YruB-family [Parcubacteria group bacterium GW2011_GWB1_49_7]|uniref:NrdH-redoxin n=1 Tax=Candidatus Zambryskibacteria bacterium RIFCSPHIGHO2_01_FULL_46_25 TaxID=1802738 RepID=A0A1G2T0V1_9BACT|nr:MAG: Glutaredoxin-like protein, YruB-family [Parcubacteria group bacterium GW2011_GWA1_47_10]KKW10062.1 MAG: Glutaredoxin-like protein, YruB-family [Parcubacteria group bacterium GW2011_GWB1_49_7]OHA90459.1 MAG: NrdH-redoxin [Candidatus Zambryskibacteria bacterium RIFCSPHIGHO2_01_FULL_46_25]OHB01968.1 MAG: NrdH-redoxin [Candidatus Zambryskibacteria bacterium RIFCSPHIGHO2_12_FULL_48_10]OHB06997.1 MAG: NrdH-redoxin [Candidatus Zambryskibacteria bacterium RIFCSPLOWO2_01_FULL_48_25]